MLISIGSTETEKLLETGDYKGWESLYWPTRADPEHFSGGATVNFLQGMYVKRGGGGAPQMI